jgi:hypothetical protein
MEAEITKDVLKKMNKQKAPFVLIGVVLGPLGVGFSSGALSSDYAFWILLLSELVAILLYFIIINFSGSKLIGTRFIKDNNFLYQGKLQEKNIELLEEIFIEQKKLNLDESKIKFAFGGIVVREKRRIIVIPKQIENYREFENKLKEYIIK